MSSRLHITYEKLLTNCILENQLEKGIHEMLCIVENVENRKKTILQRAFQVYSSSCLSCLPPLQSASTLSHEAILTLHDQSTQFSLFYPTSSKVHFLMKIDWSHLMLYLNPLILLIIFLFYWGCRKWSLQILKTMSSPMKSFSMSFVDCFFVKDRILKYNYLKTYFRTYPWLIRTIAVRLLLFMSDPMIFYGVLLSVFCHLFLPIWFRDERVVVDLVVKVVGRFVLVFY